MLAEHGVPLVVASHDQSSAEELRRAITDQVRAAQPGRDSIGGGVVIAGSLEDVLRVLGGEREITDDTRDLGVVLIISDGQVAVAHYVRPVERDAAGHLQRRPPAVLAARGSASGVLDSFYWAYTDELATRAGVTRGELEDERDARARRLQIAPVTADEARSRDQ
ncbi:MAG TPA: hypothetical protein VH371_11370 [Candidatus Limnocylindrales bacterium]